MKKRAATIFLALVAVAGCGDHDTEKTSAAQSDPAISETRGVYTATREKPVIGIAKLHPSSVVQTAIFHWTLEYDQKNECLYLEPVNPKDAKLSHVVPFWPDGTEPVTRDGKFGVKTPTGVILQGDNFASAIWRISDSVIGKLRENGIASQCLNEGVGGVEIHL